LTQESECQQLIEDLSDVVTLPRRNQPGGMIAQHISELAMAAAEPTRDPQLDRISATIRRDLTKAWSISSPIFRNIINDQLVLFREETDLWANGVFEVRGTYSQVLVRLYKSANTVFATSLPEYMETWRTAFGDDLLQAHIDSRAAVQRIFILGPDSTDISEIAAKQQEAGVTVYLFDKSRHPHQDASDFTIINGGEAIGVTMHFGAGSMSARWYFNDEIKTKIYSRMQEDLLASSSKFSPASAGPSRTNSPRPNRRRRN
jgi:hypothetical protein